MILSYLKGTWQTLAVSVALILAAFLLGQCDGRRTERARNAAERAEANAAAVTKDADAKEAAAVERLNDTQAIDAIERNQNDAFANATDDAAVRRAAACQRLRAQRGAGAALPAGC